MKIKQKKRQEISSEYKWNLDDLYTSETDWRKDVNIVATEFETLANFQNKLTTGEALKSCLNKYFAVKTTIDRIFVYAKMKLDENTTISSSQGMLDTAKSTQVKFNTTTAFIKPEILALDINTINNFITTTPSLEIYKQYLNNIMRAKAHTLNADMEKLLANTGDVYSAPYHIAEMLRNADMQFGYITGENGSMVEITHSRYSALLQSPNRRIRKDAFETYYSAYDKLKNSYAATLSSNIKKEICIARTRKHKSTLDASLFEYNIPRTVYEQLIETVNEFIPTLHRLVAIRKKALMLDELHIYDNYMPLINQTDTKITYTNAKKKLVDGLAPLGKDYVNTMQKGMESGWIDVYSNEGKRSGAYSWGTPSSHPYVLLNYEDRLDDMFTLAHEMGHAMHSHYAWSNQPKVYAEYSIFLAEIASTVNETLLMEYMLQTTTDPKTRMYLLGEYINRFKNILFVQTMFAEFELITHSMAEKEEPLTVETFNKVYQELNMKYWGSDMVIDEQFNLGWAKTPHFYRSFYVYQYATGYSAAIALTKRLQSGDSQALEDYLNFLKAGSSDYPINILKKVGVDMSTAKPVHEALQVFEGLVSEMELYFK